MSQIETAVEAILNRRPRNIVTLTGAGISAESGIPTFRGPGGLWENHRPEELATPSAFARDPLLVWRWYEWRRALVREAQPNPAHTSIASLETIAGIESSVVTQNVDGLHRRGGTRNLVELHGNIFEVRCTAEGRPVMREEPFEALPPRCDCGALLRPGVVWFGESLPPGAWERAVSLVVAADLVLVVGTSGVVYPAAGLIGYLEDGFSIEVNVSATDLSTNCDFSIRQSASEAVPLIVSAIERARS
jgi:NAD-dependent deacetylase